jgi:hypothetical protein
MPRTTNGSQRGGAASRFIAATDNYAAACPPSRYAARTSGLASSSAPVPERMICAVLQHVAAMRRAQGVVGVLLDEQDGHAVVAVELADDLEDLLDVERRQAERGLVEQQQLRPAHQRAGDRQHLLLAARQRAGALLAALFRIGKSANMRLRSTASSSGRPCTAPICRFSITVMRGKMRRPSGTSAMPRRAISCVGSG